MQLNLNHGVPGLQPLPRLQSPRPGSSKFIVACVPASGIKTRGIDGSKGLRVSTGRKVLPEASLSGSVAPYEDSASWESKLVTVKSVLAGAASVKSSIMLARAVADEFIPRELQDYMFRRAQNYVFTEVRNFFSRASSQATVVIHEFDGLESNLMYKAVQAYLSTKISPTAQRLKISNPKKGKNFDVSMDSKEEIIDAFDGVKIKWSFAPNKAWPNSQFSSKSMRSFEPDQFYELSFPKRHQDMVINSYLPCIVETANSLTEKKKTTMRLFSNRGDYNWTSVNLDHPATFETLAMDSDNKRTLLKDLERFVKRKDYYRKIGKAWKRGYLLYGPPGTGKSSLVAAMANYLNFDIYDLELTSVSSNYELRRLLMATANRSILVVEDIDRTIDFKRDDAVARLLQQRQLTLSGLLNFADGLWSTCGDERIIIFTTNHKEKLDPALLRPGRMDVHVHMSYCTPCGFKVLAANYLDIKNHALFGEIGDLILSTEVTPAEVADQFLKGGENPDDSLRDMIEFLKVKKIEKEELKARKLQEELEEQDKKIDNAAEKPNDGIIDVNHAVKDGLTIFPGEPIALEILQDAMRSRGHSSL